MHILHHIAGRSTRSRGESEIKAHTHDIGALGLEGVCAACVQVRAVVALQEPNVVEALSLQRRR